MRVARWLALLLFLPLAPACAPEPTFDERFEETASQIERKAEELERELAQPPAEESASGNDQTAEADPLGN